MIKTKSMFAAKEPDDGLRVLICEDVAGEYPYPKPEGWKFDDYVDLYLRQLKPPFLAEGARLRGGIDARLHGMTPDAYFLKNCREHFFTHGDYVRNTLRLLAGYSENHNVTLMCFCPELSVCHVGIVREAIEMATKTSMSDEDTDADAEDEYFASLLEPLAELEHEQWIEWSKTLASKENLSAERLRRWAKLWVPYSQLTEAMKERDRIWARKAIAKMAAKL